MEEGFPDAQPFVLCVTDEHFEKIIQFLSTNTSLEGYTMQQKEGLVVKVENFFITIGNLYKMGSDEILRRYVPKYEFQSILPKVHGGVARGHYAGRETTEKIL